MRRAWGEDRGSTFEGLLEFGVVIGVTYVIGV